MTETTVGPDLLQPLEIVAELRVDTVGEGLRVLAVDDVLLPVEEPGGDLVLRGVLLETMCVSHQKRGRVFETVGTHEDRDNPLKLLRGELTSTTTILAQRVPKPIRRIREFVPLREVDIGLLEDKVGVLLKSLADVLKIVSWWRNDCLPDGLHP